MAAVALTLNTPTRTAVTTARQRYTMPTGATAPVWVRIYSASDCYLELGDHADGGVLGSAYETIPAGVVTARMIRRGEFCIAGSASQTVEVTVTTREGPG